MAALLTSRSLSNACAIASIPAATSATLTTRCCRIRPHPRTRHNRPSLPCPALPCPALPCPIAPQLIIPSVGPASDGASGRVRAIWRGRRR